MISHIHNIHNLQKRFEELKRTCTQGCKAAYRASQLVSAMKQGAQRPVHRKLTRHGELRIKNCKKFDLGGGYRLITVQQGTHIHLLYAGSHDDCHQWIENHRGYVPVADDPEDVFTVTRPETTSLYEQPETSERDYEDLLMQKIDDRMLRWVFRGLCNDPSSY
jgi:hypothetical protein